LLVRWFPTVGRTANDTTGPVVSLPGRWGEPIARASKSGGEGNVARVSRRSGAVDRFHAAGVEEHHQQEVAAAGRFLSS
jgi:hypothetical protein